jgi:ribosomal protein S18 acetylase RimI-like enzyme
VQLEHYLNNNGDFLIGEIESHIVAMGAFRRTSSMPAEIMRMRVHPDYQGQGFGQQILNELETRARARGYTTLLLHTSTVQIAAQKLYEKHGYHEVGREMFQRFEIILYEEVLGYCGGKKRGLEFLNEKPAPSLWDGTVTPSTHGRRAIF